MQKWFDLLSQWEPGKRFTFPFPSGDTIPAAFHGPAALHLRLCFARPGCVTKMQQSRQWRNKASKAAADEQKFRVRGAFNHPPHGSNTCCVLRVMMLQPSIQTCLFMKNTTNMWAFYAPTKADSEGLLMNPDTCQPFILSDSFLRFSSFSTISLL